MNAPEQHLASQEGADDQRASLLDAPSREAACARWLAWLADMLPELQRAFVLLGDASNTLATAAVRPAGVNPELSRPLVLQAITQRELATRSTAVGHELAFPLLVGARVRGVVTVEVVAADGGVLTRARTTVQWGMGWLCSLAGDTDGAASVVQLGRARQALELSMSLNAEVSFKPAVMLLVNQLCRRFDCTSVQLGWFEDGASQLVARSNSAWQDRRSDLVRLAEMAMDEAIDQGLAVRLPAAADGPLVAGRANEAYRLAVSAVASMTVPLRAHGQLMGALLFERARAFDEAELDTVEVLSLVLAPQLQWIHTADESVWRHLRRKWQSFAAWLGSSRSLGWKLIGGAAAVLLLLAAIVPVTYRVGAPAVVEGQTQRVAVAPFAGYIRSASARAGDVVKSGQVLAQLDDKDLVLEQVRWEAELEVALRREREALASADRVTMRLSAAQAGQAKAQLDLVKEKLGRLQITAPFDAVVVKGDLSQQLGSPVETGKVLFELAPMKAWRVILKVDERDIAWVEPGQRGELVLASLPGQSFAVDAERVQSVAVAEEGRNYFRVEAGLGEGAARLRPGMEGVAKIVVGRAPLLWTWTHRFSDWLRRTLWEWTP